MAKPRKLKWLDVPEGHDYPAAANYLSLVLPANLVAASIDGLRTAPDEYRKAKDILRAAGLRLLPRSNPHVTTDLAKVAKGLPLSPILLVRGDARIPAPLLVADGYHRVCASFHLDENTDIPCRIADRPATAPPAPAAAAKRARTAPPAKRATAAPSANRAPAAPPVPPAPAAPPAEQVVPG
jgi:hypothetical protein